MEIIKRDGEAVPFDDRKIRNAVLKALAASGLPSESVADKVTADVVLAIGKMDSITVERVQDLVEDALMKRGLNAAAKAYILYRDEHTRRRKQLKVRKVHGSKQSVTDKSMLIVQSMTDSMVAPWDRSKITSHLVTQAHMDQAEAAAVAKDVEDRVLATGLETVNSEFVRELVNSVLTDKGYTSQLQDLTSYKVPKDYIDGLLDTKVTENSNIVSNNPEAVSLAITDLVLKQYALDNVFSEDVKRAHDTAAIYIHDLGYPHRVYCSSHSIEYIKKYGLKGLNNLNTTSKPAKSASVLTGHLNTFLASMQANYAGALGLGYVNIFYAPYLKGMEYREMKQVAQEMIFNGSQNAFSRGGQSLHPSELIWVLLNGKYQSVRIGEFVDAYIQSMPDRIRHTDAYEVVNTEDLGIQAVSFEKQGGRVLGKPIMYVARMPHKGKMYRVHTSNGIVNVTGDHSLFTFKGKHEIVPTKTKELKKGDFVVIPHRVTLPLDQEYALVTDYVPEEWLAVKGFDKVACAVKAKGNPTKVLEEAGETRYIMNDGKKYDKIRLSLAKRFVKPEEQLLSICGDSQAFMPARLSLTRSVGYIAGLFCAEGQCAHKKVIVSNTSSVILGKLTACLDDIGYSWYRYNPGMKMGMTTDQVEINGILGAFIQFSCADEENSKIVPSWVYTASRECKDGFIEGFYDGEGSNRTGQPNEWSVSNTSTRVISGMSLLMLDKGRETYVYETAHPLNPNWSTTYELRESRRRKVCPFGGNSTVEGYRKQAKHVKKENREAVDWLIESDLSISIIKKIEEYEYDGYVYDISVPGTEAFLGGIGNVFFKNTLFLDYNIHTGVPSYLEKVPAIGPGGKYMASCSIGRDPIILTERVVDDEWQLVYVPEMADLNEIVLLRERNGSQVFQEPEGWHVLTYGDYKKEAIEFAHALLDVWYEGDSRGRVFEFPKCDFHVSAETFTDSEQYEVYKHACRLAAHNGSTYFVFDRDSVSLASCCRLRVQITDMSLLKHPEHLRTCGFGNVTINVPQAAYRARRAGDDSLDNVLKEIDKAMDLAKEAHLQKKVFVERMMKPGGPLWQLGKEANDGRPYLDLKDCTYIIGIIGVNDAVHFLTGKEMHEAEEAMDMALRIAGHMYLRCKEYTKETGLVFKLEESPAESAARKIAKSDLVYFRPEALTVYKGGDEDHAYYTNSIHLSADAPVDLLERIDAQAKFNSIIEAGAITHAFIGEEQPQPAAIAEIIREAFLRTQSAQIVFSPEFTYCETCGRNSNGLHEKCPVCGSTDVVGETRIVGYFSKVRGWNLSKLAELRARQHGKYNVQK